MFDIKQPFKFCPKFQKKAISICFCISVLETNSAVNTTIVPPGEQFYHHNPVARAPSPQFPLSQYTHEGAVSPRPNSKYGTGARAPSPQMLSHNNANFVMPRAPSPQLHVSTYNLGEIGPPRNQVARAPSPQLTMTNYMQDGGEYHAMTLGRKSSSNSLHHSTSSGYSSQHTTPTCSEDTIASHGKCISITIFGHVGGQADLMCF